MTATSSLPLLAIDTVYVVAPDVKSFIFLATLVVFASVHPSKYLPVTIAVCVAAIFYVQLHDFNSLRILQLSELYAEKSF